MTISLSKMLESKRSCRNYVDFVPDPASLFVLYCLCKNPTALIWFIRVHTLYFRSMNESMNQMKGHIRANEQTVVMQ
jgi:hypothetical protein